MLRGAKWLNNGLPNAVFLSGGVVSSVSQLFYHRSHDRCTILDAGIARPVPLWLACHDRRRGRCLSMRAHWLAGLAVLGALAGCAPQRPGFLGRLQQDCEAGDRDACVLLAGPMVPPEPGGRSSQAPSRPRTAVQRDVDAIMQGMDRNHLGLRLQAQPDDGS